MSGPDTTEIRFICDDNLGKLARYLRVGGFDTAFDSRISNSELIRISLDEHRHILTRHRNLAKRTLVRHYFLIMDDLWTDQLKAVISHFGLKFLKSRMLQRCLEDNTPTEPRLKQDIKSLVYPYIFEYHNDFCQCPLCGRIYWPGSHAKAMIKRLTDVGIDIIE